MLMLLAVVRWFPLVLACLAAGGWGMLLFFSTANTLVQTSVSDAMRGRVMGIWALVFGGLMPLGGLESGALAQAVGVPWTIAGGALVCAGVGWWFGGPDIALPTSHHEKQNPLTSPANETNLCP
jgi:MFS family permease